MRFLLLLCVMPLAAECLPSHGDYILGSDLATADPRLSSLPQALQLGNAPLAGLSRTFTKAELQRIAHTNGIVTPDGFSEICFTLPVHDPEQSSFVDAMKLVLPQSVSIHIAEISHIQIPEGNMEFPLPALEPAGIDGTRLWRGFVQYTHTRRTPIWARVLITATSTTVVPEKNLAPNTSINSSWLRVETRTGPWTQQSFATRIEEVAGHVVLRSIPAGTAIPLALIDTPPAIHRGDSVRVEIRSGSAVLHFDAIAQTSAHTGEVIDFRNPNTGRTFRARAEGSSKAVMILGKGPGL